MSASRRLKALSSQVAAGSSTCGVSAVSVAPKTVLLTGANRGLGLEFVRQYSQAAGIRLYACCRTPNAADELKVSMPN